MIELIAPTIGFFLVIGVLVYLDARKGAPCDHKNTRCLHGDEVLQHIRVFVIRRSKGLEMHRQECLDCGRSLPRVAICTATGNKDQHVWHGPWPKHYTTGEYEY